MAPPGFPNGRKWACHWPMCSWQVLLPKSEGAASPGCSILRVQHPQGEALLWVSSFGVLAESFKMLPSSLSNGRKWACHWPMCSWEVLLPKSDGAASSRCSILWVHIAYTKMLLVIANMDVEFHKWGRSLSILALSFENASGP